MDNEKKLLEGFKKLSKEQMSGGYIMAIVKEVNNDSYTITASDDGFEYTDVQLKSIVDNEQLSIIIVPEIDSSVIISELNKSTHFVVKVNEIKELKIMFKDGLNVVLNKDNLVINEGDFGGLIKIDELLKKVNRLEDSLKSHQHLYIPYPSGVAATPVPSTAHPQNTFVNTKRSEIENTKVTHG